LGGIGGRAKRANRSSARSGQVNGEDKSYFDSCFHGHQLRFSNVIFNIKHEIFPHCVLILLGSEMITVVVGEKSKYLPVLSVAAVEATILLLTDILPLIVIPGALSSSSSLSSPLPILTLSLGVMYKEKHNYHIT
jgi:hypothetical protein